MIENKDISKSAIRKAVLGRSAQQATTVYPGAIALLGGVSAAAFGLNIFTLGALGVGAALGLSGFLGGYFLKKDQYAANYISSIRADLVAQREKILEGLEDELSALGEHRGVLQIDKFNAKYDNLVAILGKRLNQNELTYMRYLTIAEQVFLGGIDNLESVALTLRSVSTIDLKNLQWQLDNAKSQGDQTLIDSLQQRVTLYEEQHRRAEQLLSQNDAALTQLDHVTTSLANTRTSAGHAVMQIDDAMSELSKLIKRSEHYSIDAPK